jgi:hypothetical protein
MLRRVYIRADVARSMERVETIDEFWMTATWFEQSTRFYQDRISPSNCMEESCLKLERVGNNIEVEDREGSGKIVCEKVRFAGTLFSLIIRERVEVYSTAAITTQKNDTTL